MAVRSWIATSSVTNPTTILADLNHLASAPRGPRQLVGVVKRLQHREAKDRAPPGHGHVD
jgi:hypothetical protein